MHFHLKKGLGTLLLLYLTGFFLVACGPDSNPTEAIRPSQLLSMTQVVTAIVIETAPAKTAVTPEANFITIPTAQVTLTSIPFANDNGAVIAKYFALLGEHQYEKAYELLAEKARSYYKSKQDYINQAKSAFIGVNLQKLIRYNEWRSESGTHEVKNDNWYYYEIYAEGEGGMSGAHMNGRQSGFALEVFVDGEWKIEEFITSIPDE